MSLAASEIPSGFWSYVHKDDEAERGRILNLCELIKSEFALLTGLDLELFIDRSGIAWGDKWRVTIDSALTETTFLIAIVTPRFLVSKECRRELLTFSQNAKARGVLELLFPILYIDVDGLVETSSDEVLATIAATQYEDFRELRLVEEDSSVYRTAVHKMANRLIEIANVVAARAESPTGLGMEPDSGPEWQPDDSPGFIDSMNEVELLIPSWLETIDKFTELMNQVGKITSEFTPRMQAAAKKGSAAQIVAADQYAKAVRPSAEAFRETGTRYVEQAVAVSQSVIAILDELTLQAKEEEPSPEVLQFFGTMLELVDASEEASGAIQGFQESIRQNYRYSRAIRAPLKLLDEGAQQFLDVQGLLDDWKRRITEILGTEPDQDQ